MTSSYMPSTAKSQTHLTPKMIADPVHAFCRAVGRPGGVPDLDPCAADGDLTGAAVRYLIENGQDGLVLPWRPYEVIYCNPPYDTAEDEGKLGKFTARCRMHRTHGACITLLPAQKTDKIAWQRDVLPFAAKICWVYGRLKFHGAKNGAPFPSAVALFATRKHYHDEFEKAFSHLGRIR